MQEQFAGQVEIIGVGGSGSAGEMRDFVADTGVGGFAHLQDVENRVWETYGIRTQPRFAFINDDGTVEITGGMGEAGLREQVQALIES